MVYSVSPVTLWIVTGIFFFLILLIPALVIFSRWFFTRNSKPDPAKATINVHTGNIVRPPIKGTRYYTGEEGELYSYWQDKRQLTVLVPPDYGYEFQRNRRLVDVLDGNAIARPRHAVAQGTAERRLEISAQDLSNLTKGYVFETLVSSLKSSALPGLLILLLVGGIALGVGFVGAKYMGSQQTAASSTATPTATPAPGQPGGGIPAPDQGQGQGGQGSGIQQGVK